jgi:hypothetical protein
MHVKTLVVMATNRGQFIATDQFEAIEWSHSESFLMVIVDGGGAIDSPFGPEPGPREYAVIPNKLMPKLNLSGFITYQGIQWAIDQGITFDRVLVLDDDALPIGLHLDIWARLEMEKCDVDLLGVRDRVNYQMWWPSRGAFVRDLCTELPADFAPTAETIFFASHWMSRKFVDRLVERRFLAPEKYETWDLWPDVYISWLCQALGFQTQFAGSMENPEAPVYANHPKEHQRWSPAPMILHPNFKIYHSIRGCSGVDEVTIREHYQAVRHSQVSDGLHDCC